MWRQRLGAVAKVLRQSTRSLGAKAEVEAILSREFRQFWSFSTVFSRSQYHWRGQIGVAREAGLGFRTTTRAAMFIETQSTPNDNSLMFLPRRPVMESGAYDFTSARAAMISPLATK